MSDSIEDILRARTQSEPPEFAVIRKFVQDRFTLTPQLATSGDAIVIGVPSGAIAGNLRLCLRELEEKLQSSVRLRIRIQ